MYVLSQWLHQLLAWGACECFRAFRFPPFNPTSYFLDMNQVAYHCWCSPRLQEEHSCLFSIVYHKEECPTTTIFLQRSFLLELPLKGMWECKKLTPEKYLWYGSIGDFFVFCKNMLTKQEWLILLARIKYICASWKHSTQKMCTHIDTVLKRVINSFSHLGNLWSYAS